MDGHILSRKYETNIERGETYIFQEIYYFDTRTYLCLLACRHLLMPKHIHVPMRMPKYCQVLIEIPPDENLIITISIYLTVN